MYRLGYTETTLLFFYYLDKILDFEWNNQMKEKYRNQQKTMVQWLYSTSGFYDSSIKGSYFDFDADACLSSIVYNKYMNDLLDKVNKYEKGCTLCFHNIHSDLERYKEDFIAFVDKRATYKMYQGKEKIFTFLKEKQRVLIVNDIASLFVQQWEAGNCKKIFPDFPDIDLLMGYNPGTTFFNKGHHGSILQSISIHCKILSEWIDTHDIRGVIIACGAYTVFLADFIYKNKKVDVLCPGGGISENFGVLTNRIKKFGSLYKTNEPTLWINVPDEKKPENHEKIEKSVYW